MGQISLMTSWIKFGYSIPDRCTFVTDSQSEKIALYGSKRLFRRGEGKVWSLTLPSLMWCSGISWYLSVIISCKSRLLDDAPWFCKWFSVIVHCSANLLSIWARRKHRSDMETASDNKMPEGMGSRIAVSILTLFGSLIGIILWLFFYAGNFNVYQNIAIVVVILLSFIAVMGATWASWGMKQAAMRSKKEDSWNP